MDYVNSPNFGNGSFGHFLPAWFLIQGVTDLFQVKDSATRRTAAIAANLAYIRGERTAMRIKLGLAQSEGKLAFTDGPVLPDFTDERRGELSNEQLCLLDGVDE